VECWLSNGVLAPMCRRFDPYLPSATPGRTKWIKSLAFQARRCRFEPGPGDDMETPEKSLFWMFISFCILALLFGQMNLVLIGFLFLFAAVEIDVRPRRK
jgi:hypothetical protein